MKTFSQSEKKSYYGITAAIDELVEDRLFLKDGSTTTIRCALNDLLDTAQKCGQKVSFEFDQDRAVKIVKRKLGLLGY